MALVIICGYPSSLKTCFSNNLKNYIKDVTDLQVNVINDDNYIQDKNDTYKNLKREMELRQSLKSAVKTNLNDKTILVLDSTNYIKSFRYELYCLAKSLGLKYCVIYCCITKEDVISINDKRSDCPYDKNILNELMCRFEEPSYNNRWDMPLFIVDPRRDDIDFKDIYDTILLKNVTLKPNIATQNQTLPLNYLQEVDQRTQEIVKEIIEAQQRGENCVIIGQNESLAMCLPKKYTVMELYKIRRNFINMMNNNFSSKVQDSSANILDNVPQIFIQFITESHNTT